MTPEELKEWRDKHKLSQSELGDLLRVRANTIARWERGEMDFPPYLALALEALHERLNKNK